MVITITIIMNEFRHNNNLQLMASLKHLLKRTHTHEKKWRTGRIKFSLDLQSQMFREYFPFLFLTLHSRMLQIFVIK